MEENNVLLYVSVDINSPPPPPPKKTPNFSEANDFISMFNRTAIGVRKSSSAFSLFFF